MPAYVPIFSDGWSPPPYWLDETLPAPSEQSQQLHRTSLPVIVEFLLLFTAKCSAPARFVIQKTTNVSHKALIHASQWRLARSTNYEGVVSSLVLPLSAMWCLLAHRVVKDQDQ